MNQLLLSWRKGRCNFQHSGSDRDISESKSVGRQRSGPQSGEVSDFSQVFFFSFFLPRGPERIPCPHATAHMKCPSRLGVGKVVGTIHCNMGLFSCPARPKINCCSYFPGFTHTAADKISGFFQSICVAGILLVSNAVQTSNADST